jgi:hypothetical protein
MPKNSKYDRCLMKVRRSAKKYHRKVNEYAVCSRLKK